MIRDTSIDAYNFVQQCGYVGERQKLVYEILYHHGPLTGNELFEVMKRDYDRNINQQNITTRLGELRDMGCVIELTKRPCKITGIRVIEWDVNSKHPVKLERKKSKDEIIKELQEEILRLKKEISKYDKIQQGVLF